MGMNQTPSANRVHIGFFGLRNAGKSSVVNAVTNQSLSVVSDVLGTTTDPVQKAMELLPIGPVVIIDTPGIDDEGALGTLRVKKAKQILNKTDVAVLIVDATKGKSPADEELIGIFKEKQIPYVIALNKADLLSEVPTDHAKNEVYVSAVTKSGIEELKNTIGSSVKVEELTGKLVGDLVKPGDFVVLVTPIDSAAPKGRMILPQQQTIRDVLESGAMAVVIRETELEDTLKRLGEKPALVITDSQAFGKVDPLVPKDVRLTSFSILFARLKGDLEGLVEGVQKLDHLQDGDAVLISEGCTHHRQCGDIGSVKIPKWLKEYTGKDLKIALSSGTEFPEDLEQYALIIHCGGCMLNEREMKYRMKCAKDAGVPMINYGMMIAQVHGILKRSLEPFVKFRI